MTSRRMSFSGIRISSATSRETSQEYSTGRWAGNPSGEPPSAESTGCSAGTVVPRFTRPSCRARALAARPGRWSGSEDRHAAGGHPGDRVHLLAVLAADAHLEVQVRAGAVAQRPDQPDQLAGLDPLADPDQHLLLVAVHGHVAVRVLDHDRVAVPGLRA